MKFDYTQHEDNHVGFIEFGAHSISEVEIYDVNGELFFVDHDDPESPMSYEECKRFFIDHDARTEWDEQMKEQGLLR